MTKQSVTPKLVLVITDQEKNAQLNKLGVDFLELRVDLFKKTDVDYCSKQIQDRRKLKIPLILTIRNQKKEGAVKEMSDAKKLELIEALLPSCHWVDIELSSPLCKEIVTLARGQHKKVLISAHDFNHIPHLQQIFKKALSTRADMVKIAVKANSNEDLLEMITFTHAHRRHSLVTMCVGPWGPLSRLILPAAGSPWVYSFLNKPTAPGQMNINILQSQLKCYYP